MTALHTHLGHRPTDDAGTSPWTIQAVLNLGMTTDIETAGAIIGIGRSKAYELAKNGEFPSRSSALGAATSCRSPPSCACLTRTSNPTDSGTESWARRRSRGWTRLNLSGLHRGMRRRIDSDPGLPEAAGPTPTPAYHTAAGGGPSRRGPQRARLVWHSVLVLPPPGARGRLIEPPDAFDVPVFVRWSAPLNPGRRPLPTHIDGASAPWPIPGMVPSAGAYRAPTTWRDVIDAATTVGRDPTPWLTAAPALSWAEIVARRSPLVAYLGRRRCTTGTGGGFLVEPNVVYREGTEKTAQAAFGYRIGMTMAEWVCRGLMGLGPTAHAEAHKPANAGPAWSFNGLPDLVGAHPLAPTTWLIEAKGARRLGRGALRKGAAQLSAPGLIAGPHLRVLCGASLEHRLFVTVDVEEIPVAAAPGHRDAADPREDDAALLALARSRMLSYLALVALPPGARRVVPVGYSATDRATRGGTGLVALLEQDPSTESERAAARDGERYWRHSPGRSCSNRRRRPASGPPLGSSKRPPRTHTSPSTPGPSRASPNEPSWPLITTTSTHGPSAPVRAQLASPLRPSLGLAMCRLVDYLPTSSGRAGSSSARPCSAAAGSHSVEFRTEPETGRAPAAESRLSLEVTRK